MKKILAIALMSSFATGSFASTSDYRTVIVENNDKQETFSLNTVTTRTEYRTEVVHSTCYRQEIAGYRRVCYPRLTLNRVIGPHPVPNPPRDPRDPPPERKPEPRPTPYPNPRPEPRPEPRPPVCYDEPIYRQVAYSCLKTISVPYEVVDHESRANVEVKMSAAPATKPQSGNCGINFTLQGDHFSAANSCREYLAVALIGRQENGTVKNLSYFINLFDAEKIFAPLAGGLSDLHVEGNTLVVRTGDLRSNTNFALSLYVERKRFLKEDVVLINRALTPSEFSYQPADERTGLVRINLDKVLGGFEEGKKHVIKLKMDLSLPQGSIINGSPIPQLHQEASTTVF